FILAIDEIFSHIFRCHMRSIQIDGFLRTGLLTKTAENTAQHIDFIYRSIFLFSVKMLFTLLTLGSNHSNGLCRTGQSTQTAVRASLSALLVTLQRMSSPEILRIRPYLFRILYSVILLEKMS